MGKLQSNNPTLSIPLESEDESLARPGNVVESLVSPSCNPKEIPHLDRTNLEQPSPETTANC